MAVLYNSFFLISEYPSCICVSTQQCNGPISSSPYLVIQYLFCSTCNEAISLPMSAFWGLKFCWPTVKSVLVWLTSQISLPRLGLYRVVLYTDYPYSEGKSHHWAFSSFCNDVCMLPSVISRHFHGGSRLRVGERICPGDLAHLTIRQVYMPHLTVGLTNSFSHFCIHV